MANPNKILVAYDGSPHSKVALGWAMLLGSNENAELDVIKVFEPLGETSTVKFDYNFRGQLAERYAELEKEDRQMLEEVKVFCQKHRIAKVHVDVLKGHAASALLDYARQSESGLIVTGTKGHGVLSEMLVGSVTSSLVTLSKVPVLVVKDQPAPPKLQKILVAYDGSHFAKTALDQAIDISKRTDAKLLLVKVNDPLDFLSVYSWTEFGSATRLKEQLDEMDKSDRQLMDDAKSIANLKGIGIETEFLSGVNIADVLIRHAKETDTDMIVAGTLGHGLLGGLLLGSVTRNLVSLSKIPVLVVKQ